MAYRITDRTSAGFMLQKINLLAPEFYN